MNVISYTIRYANGDTEIVSVTTRNINSGFAKALKLALQPLGNGKRRDLHSIEFSVAA